ncbi:DoxX family protein [Paraburkholderia sp.]|uniref:DoxX family protein n=1 Tax=Paraburkholderia sp. TaxID=1926495 RepID=UPI003D6FDC3E
MLRNLLTFVTRVSRSIRRPGAPWFLLATRLWVGQVVFVHQMMQMVQGKSHGLPQGGLPVSSSVEVAIRSVAPIVVSIGLLTRPVAVVLLAGEMSTDLGIQQLMVLPLLVWLAVLGPGTLSLDALLSRGFPFAPVGPLRLVSTQNAGMAPTRRRQNEKGYRV